MKRTVLDVTFKMGRDVNGNSVVKVSKAGLKGFSIPTNGYLVETHRTKDPHPAEICKWVEEHGTPYQKGFLSVISANLKKKGECYLVTTCYWHSQSKQGTGVAGLNDEYSVFHSEEKANEFREKQEENPLVFSVEVTPLVFVD